MALVRTILLVSHSPTGTTGYGRVARRVAHSLRVAGFELLALGAGYAGGPHELPYCVKPWRHDGHPDSIAEAIRECHADVLLTIGDPWMFEQLPHVTERRDTTWIAYFPIDGYPLPPAWKGWIEAIDVPIVFSRFTQDLVSKAVGKTPELIYHGVDTARFRPTDKREAKTLAHVQDHFVVGTVARNQQRKNLPALMKAFARFAADKPDALLYLHTQIRGEWDLQELAVHLGIESKTRVTADLGISRGVPDAMLATVYNAMDVFVLPTMAEGFGLPIMEAQACGTPVLVTDFSACPELVVDPIQRLKVKDTLVMYRNFEQAVVDVDDVVAKLEYLYRNPDERTALGRRCHEFAQQFEWSIACDQFVKLIDSLAERFPERMRSGQAGARQITAHAGAGNQQRTIQADFARDTEIVTGRLEKRPSMRAALEHQRAGRLAEAEAVCREVMRREPRNVSALHLLGVLYGQRGELDAAVALLADAAGFRPYQAEIQNDLGVVWEAKGEAVRAAECYKKALELRPGVHQVLVNLANAYLQAHELAPATTACDEALRLAPNYEPAHNLHGAILAEERRAHDACTAFREAIRLRPDYAEAHANLGLALLSIGCYAEGWQEHEWRRRLPGKQRVCNRPLWDGSDPFGRSILLYAEGGLGNTIQFIRFAPLLAAQGAIISVECQPPLVRLLETVNGIRHVVAHGQPLPHHDVQFPLMSVPAILKTTGGTIPDVPYLQADTVRADRWNQVFAELATLRIGVCWQGEQKMAHRRNRSIPLAAFAPLTKVPGARLISLQVGCPTDAEFAVTELPGLDDSGTFLDTAAVMKRLDLVITCDTSIAHLAGAMGVPVWVALPFAADWRWMEVGDATPWYPTMRLFRQQSPGDWSAPFEQMATELCAWKPRLPRESARVVSGTNEVRTAANQRTEVASVQVAKPAQPTAAAPAPDPNRPFAHFDRVVVINLDSDVDRMRRVSARLQKLGISYERFAALLPPKGLASQDPRFKAGHYACALSHRAVLERAWQNGIDRVLIFEDDVVLRDDTPNWMRRIVPQLESMEWDVFHLGLHLEIAGDKKADNLLEVKRGFHAHAYAVTRRAIPRMITFIDRVLEQMAGTFDGYEDSSLVRVCATPILAIQEPNYSHTYGHVVDRQHQYFALFDREEFRVHCQEVREHPELYEIAS